ncbi:MAG: hypothetical protein PUC27_04125, partial [Clostridium sp.]|nr:hypothetical protein [Clostridium sp.]
MIEREGGGEDEVHGEESVEDYISDENPVRVIDAFVDSLDMEGLGFQKAKPAQTGRPAYDPRELLKLYL